RLLIPLDLPRYGPIAGEVHDALALAGSQASNRSALRVRDIVPTPVRTGVPRRLGVQAVRDRGCYRARFARMFNDRLKGGKSGLPILSARRSIPFAAFGLKKYFSGTSSVSMTPNKEDPLARLWDSKVPAVKHTPCKTIPELGQRPEYKPEISSLVRAEK